MSRFLQLVSVVCSLVATASALPSSTSSSGSGKLGAEFQTWVAAFGKQYASHVAENRAFRVWLQNKAVVDSINAANRTWTAKLGVFGDMTPEEFKMTVLLPSRSYDMSEPRKSFSVKSSRPEAFDWRSITGVVTSVKNQGSVGSCWAFSTVGNIEGQWALHGGQSVDLSPEFLVDCDGSHDDKHADCSVFGGWPYLAYGFVLEAGGIPSEAAWPYCSGTGDCYPCMKGPVSLCGPPPYYWYLNLVYCVIPVANVFF
jgi:cathepsin F